MDLPGATSKLIQAVLEANPNTVIVTQSGTPITMDSWSSQARSQIHMWYGGNEMGNGLADVIFGDVNPSARLPLSFPVKCEDNPAFLNLRCEGGRILYGEDIFVGYRYYEKTLKRVLFPFG
jgi:beta-glucosidase